MPPSPDEAACVALWNKYGMLDHIRQHSRAVACVALGMARLALEAGISVDVPAVYAASLLHDLAKTHSIRHPGNHAQLGAAWVCRETRNQQVANGVMHHVRWPWPLDERSPGVVDRHFLPLAILYADKRVRHNEEVSMDDRFDDIYSRYGISPQHRERIAVTHQQALAVERLLSNRLGVNLYAHSFNCGRLVA